MKFFDTAGNETQPHRLPYGLDGALPVPFGTAQTPHATSAARTEERVVGAQKQLFADRRESASLSAEVTS